MDVTAFHLIIARVSYFIIDAVFFQISSVTEIFTNWKIFEVFQLLTLINRRSEIKKYPNAHYYLYPIKQLRLLNGANYWNL